ncbi:hypothetical protein Q4E93_24435 [Flavitalea sp. BT771]|uniref:hypothetical protein n=1 Tax=Flavitalea sp. BT771 TaxID=3063329 RepID=UPI0026E21338|nr:hypothetical protein [Flavitalea sp. BT771]MDO6433776.1 hypothetical protein [Flavitalea sp. BT771]MDV6222319.1 hypothetical protein [Flavitalea sp. BT771]
MYEKPAYCTAGWNASTNLKACNFLNHKSIGKEKEGEKITPGYPPAEGGSGYPGVLNGNSGKHFGQTTVAYL